jgi:nitrous oxidase accessory protein NosD
MASNSQIPFQPLGPTHLIAANTPAPTPVQVSVDNMTTGVGQYRVVNSGNDPVFLGVGATAAQATARAAAIVAGTPTETIVLLSGAVEILRFNNNAFFTAFAAGANNVYITPGQGL